MKKVGRVGELDAAERLSNDSGAPSHLQDSIAAQLTGEFMEKGSFARKRAIVTGGFLAYSVHIFDLSDTAPALIASHDLVTNQDWTGGSDHEREDG